jgi:hypothetical protein
MTHTRQSAAIAFDFFLSQVLGVHLCMMASVWGEPGRGNAAACYFAAGSTEYMVDSSARQIQIHAQRIPIAY